MGIVKVPVVTMFAILEPETMPVKALPRIAALAGPPSTISLVMGAPYLEVISI